MTDGRSRRLQKLQQLWAQVVSAVEAERRVRTADVSSIAASDGHKGSGASGSRCLQDRLSHGERVAEEEETRYYCPELCNTGIFRRASHLLYTVQSHTQRGLGLRWGHCFFCGRL